MRPKPICYWGMAVYVALCILVVACQAQAATITAPSGPVAVGKQLQLPILGLEPGQSDDATFLCLPQGAVAFPAQWGRTAFVLFQADKPGTYELLLVLPQDGPDEIVRVSVAVEGDAPNPPGPGPGPKPPGPGAKQLALFAETSLTPSLPLSQRSLLASLTLREDLRSRGHNLVGVLDPNLSGPQDRVPEAYVPWFRAVAGKTLPAVAVAPIGGGTIEVHPLPADEAGLLKLLGGG